MGRRTLLFLRIGVFVVACAFLWVRFHAHRGVFAPFGGWQEAWASVPVGVVVAVFLLMLLNWGIEAWKWKLLVAHVEPLPFLSAFEATIAGTAIGLITPNRVGEFAGRVLFLAPDHRVSGSFATALGSIAQFVATLVAGSMALLIAPLPLGTGLPDPVITGLSWTMVLVSFAALVYYFNPRLLRASFMVLPFLRRYAAASAVLEEFDGRELTRTLLISALRYAVFTAQFVLLLSAGHGVDLWHLAAGVPEVYLVTTLVPTVMLTELGVRGSVAVAVLASDGTDPAYVLLASVLLWVINLALPAIAGSIVLLLARIRSTGPA